MFALYQEKTVPLTVCGTLMTIAIWGNLYRMANRMDDISDRLEEIRDSIDNLNDAVTGIGHSL